MIPEMKNVNFSCESCHSHFIASAQNSLLRFYLYARRYDDVLTRMPEVVPVTLDDPASHYFYGLAYLGKGRNEEAITELKQAATEINNLSALGYAYATTGQRDEALKVIQRLQTPSGEQTFVSHYEMARVYAGLGDKESAFASLEKAFEVRDDGLTRMKIDPLMEKIRYDARYAAIMHRVGLE